MGTDSPRRTYGSNPSLCNRDELVAYGVNRVTVGHHHRNTSHHAVDVGLVPGWIAQ
jgi:hypothetical protein